MHYYSVGRNEYFGDINNSYQFYDDGTNNMLPQTSQLSRNSGYTPSQYINNQPQ